jgi:hypothetical protein
MLLRLLQSLFGQSGKTLRVDSYWCMSGVRLPSRITSPSGSKVLLVDVCVDIDYALEKDRVIVRRVRLSRRGLSLIGSSQRVNVAGTNTSEAWFASNICSEQPLRDAVMAELAIMNSPLLRIMRGKWRSVYGPEDPEPLVDALNSAATPSELIRLLKGRKGSRITFTYRKADGQVSTRHVVVRGVRGNCLDAQKQGGGEVKSFRLDRITDVRLT